MANDGGVSAAVASAKKALDTANHSSVGTTSGHSSFSSAPYSVAHSAYKRGTSEPTTSDELRVKRENVEQYVNAPKQ